MNNLVTRALSGAVFVAVFSACLFFGSWYWLGLLIVLFAISQYEYLKVKIHGLELVNYISLLLIWFGFSLAGHYYFVNYFEQLQTYNVALPAGYVFAVLLAVPVSITLIYFELKKKDKANITQLQYTFFGFFYLGLGFLCLGFLRHSALIDSKNTDQLVIAFACVAGVWVSDTFAYLTGKYLGKRKLNPAISPNKTVEGLLGGVVFTVVFELLILCYFNQTTTWYIALIYGVLLSCIATMGDLVQSLWKRNIGIKDSGNIIPGHGGILDRIDAQMLAAPFSLFYWVTISHFFI